MTDSNYEAFRNKLVAEELIFGDEEMSAMSKAMNLWRYQHLLAMAKTAAAGTDKVTLDEGFELGEMVAYLDEKLSLTKSSLFTVEDLFEALASVDPGHAEPPESIATDFETEAYLKKLETLVAKKCLWREISDDCFQYWNIGVYTHDLN